MSRSSRSGSLPWPDWPLVALRHRPTDQAPRQPKTFGWQRVNTRQTHQPPAARAGFLAHERGGSPNSRPLANSGKALTSTRWCALVAIWLCHEESFHLGRCARNGAAVWRTPHCFYAPFFFVTLRRLDSRRKGGWLRRSGRSGWWWHPALDRCGCKIGGEIQTALLLRVRKAGQWQFEKGRPAFRFVIITRTGHRAQLAVFSGPLLEFYRKPT